MSRTNTTTARPSSTTTARPATTTRSSSSTRTAVTRPNVSTRTSSTRADQVTRGTATRDYTGTSRNTGTYTRGNGNMGNGNGNMGNGNGRGNGNMGNGNGRGNGSGNMGNGGNGGTTSNRGGSPIFNRGTVNGNTTSATMSEGTRATRAGNATYPGAIGNTNRGTGNMGNGGGNMGNDNRGNDNRNGGGNMGNDNRGNDNRNGGGNMGNDNRGNDNRNGGGNMGNDNRGNGNRNGGGNMGNDNRGNDGNRKLWNNRGDNDRRWTNNGGGDRNRGNFNDRGGYNDRPGGGHNYGNDRRDWPRVNGRGHDAYRDAYRWNYSHHDWSRPLPPPARPHRPSFWWYSRPHIPTGYRYYYGAPTIERILGITFGTLFNVALDNLFYGGYNIDGYDSDIVYLRNVMMLNQYWPDVMLGFDGGKLAYAQFGYAMDRYDRYRFNSVYNALCRTYGPPVDRYNGGTNITASWFGGNGVGYVTLSLGLDGGRWYTNMSIGY